MDRNAQMSKLLEGFLSLTHSLIHSISLSRRVLIILSEDQIKEHEDPSTSFGHGEELAFSYRSSTLHQVCSPMTLTERENGIKEAQKLIIWVYTRDGEDGSQEPR